MVESSGQIKVPALSDIAINTFPLHRAFIAFWLKHNGIEGCLRLPNRFAPDALNPLFWNPSKRARDLLRWQRYNFLIRKRFWLWQIIVEKPATVLALRNTYWRRRALHVQPLLIHTDFWVNLRRCAHRNWDAQKAAPGVKKSAIVPGGKVCLRAPSVYGLITRVSKSIILGQSTVERAHVLAYHFSDLASANACQSMPQSLLHGRSNLSAADCWLINAPALAGWQVRSVFP